MPFDNRYTPDGLIRWLETKDPDESYLYTNAELCLNAQFHRYAGRWFYSLKFAFHFPFSRLGRQIEDIASYPPHTFGAALERARDAFAAR